MLMIGRCCIWVRICLEHNFPGGSGPKTPPAMLETWVLSLGLEDPLEKGLATHSSILAWRSPWTEEPGGVHGTAKSQTQLNNYHNPHLSLTGIQGGWYYYSSYLI